MLHEFVSGLAYPFRGLALIRRRGVRPMVVIPLLLNTALFAVAIVLATLYLDTALDLILPAWLDWLRWLLWPLFLIAVLAIVFFAFTLIANLLGAPFNGPLAARVELQLTGRSPQSGRTWQGEAIAAVAGEGRKLLYLAVRILPLLLLFLVPGVNLLAPLIWLAFGAWMLALEYADAPMGNHGLGFRETRLLLGQNRALALGFGSAMLVLTLVPVLNFVAMPAGVAGATAMWVERLRARPVAGDG
jgi:CysZ protein